MSRKNTTANTSRARAPIAQPESEIAMEHSPNTILGQQEIQRSLLSDLFHAIGRLEESLAPVLNRTPQMFNTAKIQGGEAPSVSPIVDELELRNSAIRNLIEEVESIRSALTLS